LTNFFVDGESLTKIFVNMARLPSPVPTEVELSILHVLWRNGPSTVRQVYNALKDERGTGYSTTLKMIQVMTDKKLLLKDDSQRPQVYRPSRREDQTKLQLVDDLIQRGFSGSAAKLVMSAVSSKRVGSDELKQIRELLKPQPPKP
jgi:predicted transcriptional regulator